MRLLMSSTAFIVIRRFLFFCPTDFTDLHRFFLGRFLSHADFADDADFFIHRMTRNFAEATCPVVTDTPWDRKKSHRFHRFTQIFLGTFFCHADFADDADFFHRMTWNFAEATCPVVADTPWDWTKRFTRDSKKSV